MKRGGSEIGNIGLRFLSWAQNLNHLIVRSGDAQKALKLSKQQEAKLLYHLSRNGLIAKIKRGLYLVPPRIPPGGKWAPSPYLVLKTFFEDLGTDNYQITGWMAFNSYGLIEQVPNRMDVYNANETGEVILANQMFRFIKVNENRLGYTRELLAESETGKKIVTYFSSLPRTVFDAIYDYERFGSLPMAYQWLKERLGNRKFMNEFIEIVIKLGNISTKRRVGYYLEKMKYSPIEIDKIRRRLKKTSSFIPLDPSQPFRGKTNKKWGIIDNETIST